jgi:dTDP-4-amino-4,6-dideoxygalactose transaminase
MLPAFNFRNPGFYLYFALLVSVPFGIGFNILAKLFFKNANKVNTKAYKCKMKLEKFISIEEPESDSALLFTGAIVSSAIILILTLIFLLTGVKLFNARNYSEQLEITQGNHEDLNTIFDYDSGEVLLPRIDKDLAFKLAEAKLGDYGSQYSIDYDNFTLISVNRNGTTELIRVTPLEYATPFVALSRMNKGTIGYIEVNVITQEAKLIKFEDGEGLKYMPSGVFSKDLDRHIRFNYPSTMYNNKYFEIDNEGNPYWVVPTIKKEIGMFSGDNNNGVLVINPRTGEIKSYKLGDNLPEWLQRAIDEVKKDGKLNLKAVITVDIFGSPCDYDKIMKIAHDNGMKVLEDAAQSYGSSYNGKKAGSVADMVATSFYPTKPLGCYGDGGATFTNSEEENELLKSCRVHGMSTTDRYDNVRLGVTGRLDSFQGAVVLQKLKVFDEELVKREFIAKRYDNELSSYYGKQRILENAKSAYGLYTINCEDRDELMAFLKENNIPCGAYYPRPVNTQTAYAQWNTRTLPVCEKLSKTVLSIPMHPYLEKEAQDYVISKMNEFAEKKLNKAA